MQGIKFGTDGIRGIVNKSITPRVAIDLGRSLALFLFQNYQNPTVIIGKDTRTSCDMLENGICLGLNACGVNCVKIGETTTPALAYITKKTNACAGVMVTASHNGYEYNGFKIFNNQGMKYDLLSTLTLERYSQILEKFDYSSPENMGKSNEDFKLQERYLKYLEKRLKEYKFKICFDCANGVTSKIIKKIFPNAKVTGIELHCNKENKNCGAINPENIKNFVVNTKSEIGFSFDGDGDRVIVALKDGTILDGDDILYALAKFYLQHNMLNKKEVVGTILTNFGTEEALNKLNIKLIRQNVGDKFICAEMRKKRLQLGAEASGHIIFAKECLTGDGIMTAIEILNLMNEVGDLKDYISEVKKYIQINDSVQVAEEMKDYVLNNCEFKSFIEECENELGCKGRLVVRKSGTENLIRILLEGQNKDLLTRISNAIKEKIEEISK